MLLRRHPNACPVRDHRLRFSLARGLRQRARVQTTKGRSASGASGGIPPQPDPYRPFGSLGRWEEFALHIRAGLANDLELCDLKEMLLQTAIYAGVPAANTGFQIATEQIKNGG
jgi:hypothetical protein